MRNAGEQFKKIVLAKKSPESTTPQLCCGVVDSYDEENKKYRGEKIINGKSAGMAIGGEDWQLFFVHLTMLGLANGEPCKFEKED